MHLTHEDASRSHHLIGQTDAHRSVKFAIEKYQHHHNLNVEMHNQMSLLWTNGSNGSQPFNDQCFRGPLRVVWSAMTCIKAVVSGPYPWPLDHQWTRLKTEGSEVPVSELFIRLKHGNISSQKSLLVYLT